MPVPVACACGKQLRVADEYRGKRIKCPECGDALAVPSRPTAAREAPSDEMIRFSCECGKQLQAKAAFAGKVTRCPDCGEKQTIPDPEENAARTKRTAIQSSPVKAKKPALDELDELEEVDERPRRRTRTETDEADDEDEDGRESRGRIQSGPSRTRKPVVARLGADEDDEDRPRRRARDEDDEEIEEERPRKKGKKGRRKTGPPLALIVGGIVAAVLLLGGGGFAAYWFLGKGGGGGAGEQEMAFIPPDAQGFMSMRLNELFQVNGFRDGFMRSAGPNNFLDEMAGSMGVASNDFGRWTMVFHDVNQKQNGLWIVATTTRPYDQKKILDSLKNQRKVTHEGRTFYVGQSSKPGMGLPMQPPGGMPGGMRPGPGGPGMPAPGMPAPGMPGGGSSEDAWYFASKTVVVRAPGETAMKAALAAASRKNAAGPLSGAIQQMQTRQFFGAVALPASAQQELKGQAKMIPGVNAAPLLEFTSATFAMDCKTNLILDLALKYPDDQRAGAASKLVSDQLDALGFAMIRAGNDPNTNALRDILKNVKVNQRGPEVTVNLNVSPKTLEVFGNRPGMGGPFGPPRR